MINLISAFEDLFAATAEGDGDQARTAQFALDSVDWRGSLGKQVRTERTDRTVTDAHLETACARSGEAGCHSNSIASALLTVADQVIWRKSPRDLSEGPDAVILSQNFAATCIIGDGGILPSDKVSTGFSLQAPDIYYPPHAHFAEESYWIVGGDGDWRVGSDPWYAVKPGDTVYHSSQTRHTMQTNALPLLCIWLWTSDLNSDVIIVRR